MDEKSLSDGSLVETTPFVASKHSRREMNYVCSLGSRLMKIIDRYLFDIGKIAVYCLNIFFLASLCTTWSELRHDVYT